MTEQFEKRMAIFHPLITDNLKEGWPSLIGETGLFQADWIAEPDESYLGQWIWRAPHEWGPIVRWSLWVPEEDLSFDEIR